ncbi:unnamed protein product, partial [Phaeothamnion confervicola]
LDAYGRRPPLATAVAGPLSTASGNVDIADDSEAAKTLARDFAFWGFDADAAASDGAADARASVGSRGQWGGEGAYGLTLVGSAKV